MATPPNIPSWVAKKKAEMKALEVADAAKKAASRAADIKREMAAPHAADAASKSVVRIGSVEAPDVLEANMSKAVVSRSGDTAGAFKVISDELDDIDKTLEAGRKAVERGKIDKNLTARLKDAHARLAKLGTKEVQDAVASMPKNVSEAFNDKLLGLTAKKDRLVEAGAEGIKAAREARAAAVNLPSPMAPIGAVEKAPVVAPAPIRPVGLKGAVQADKAAQTVEAVSVAAGSPKSVQAPVIADWVKTPGPVSWNAKMGARGDVVSIIDDPVTGRRYGQLAVGAKEKAAFVDLGAIPARSSPVGRAKGIMGLLPPGKGVAGAEAAAGTIAEVATTGAEAAGAVGGVARAALKETLGWRAKRMAFNVLGKNVIKALPVVGEVLAAADIAKMGYDFTVGYKDEASKQRAFDALQTADRMSLSLEDAQQQTLSEGLNRLDRTRRDLSQLADLSNVKTNVLLNQVLDGRQRSAGRIAVRLPPTADELMEAMN